MTVKELIKGMPVESSKGRLDVEVGGLCSDSRRLSPGDLYVALRGGAFDGHDFIGDAVRKGASAVVHEPKSIPPLNPPLAKGGSKGGGDMAFICVRDARDALAFMANNFYGRPSERLTVIGVTGTNGKTTTTRLIKSILEADGKSGGGRAPVGLIGTINYMIGDKSYPAPFTTPEAVEFQGLLREMLDAGASHAVSEVSSHAIYQRRVEHTSFAVAVFTNLTRDHLDFHGTMENYFEAKKRLFTGLLKGAAVINADDPYGRRLYDSLKGEKLSYGIDGDADIRGVVEPASLKTGRLSFKAVHAGREHSIESPLIGIHNVYNILSAIGAAVALKVSWDAVKAGIKNLALVEGRLEKIDMGQDFLCIVDYAHTDDALGRLISAARQITREGGRVITVFGCGGQRDKGKRPLMGAVAAEGSDLVFITSDNPRGEDPGEIIKDIVSGVSKDNYRVIPDRKEAIFEAIKAARPNDTVLLAGKGHESYQEIKGVRYLFSDRAVAEEAILKAAAKA